MRFFTVFASSWIAALLHVVTLNMMLYYNLVHCIMYCEDEINAEGQSAG